MGGGGFEQFEGNGGVLKDSFVFKGEGGGGA